MHSRRTWAGPSRSQKGPQDWIHCGRVLLRRHWHRGRSPVNTKVLPRRATQRHVPQRDSLSREVRIPVATALSEEIMFRSALHALFARAHSLRTTLTWTSFLFGLWHILPTLDTFEGNPASKIVQNPGRARPMLAALGFAGTTAGCRALFLLPETAFEECGSLGPHTHRDQRRRARDARILVERADSLSDADW